MSAATAAVQRSEISVIDSERKMLDNKVVSSITTLYQGIAIYTDTNGYAIPVDDTCRHWYAGYLDQQADVILMPAFTQGQARLAISKQQQQLWIIDSTITAADAGKTVFLKDDHTCSLTPTTYGNILGHITSFVDSTHCYVQPVNAPRGGMANSQYRGGQTLAANGAVALTTLDVNTVIIITNTAAQTVTLPAATGLSYGDRIFFVKYTGGNFVLTVNGNSVNINGSATYTGVANNNKSAEIMYLGSTIGWILIGGIPG